jgi:hypothetical protein
VEKVCDYFVVSLIFIFSFCFRLLVLSFILYYIMCVCVCDLLYKFHVKLFKMCSTHLDRFQRQLQFIKRNMFSFG